MATTQLTSGSITSSGTFTFPDTDWETIPGMSGGAIAPATGSWHHVGGDFTRTVQHGNCTVQVLCIGLAISRTAPRGRGHQAPRTGRLPSGAQDACGNQCAIAQVGV